MNKNWNNRPTYIDECPVDIDWILFVDESGTPEFEHIKENIKNGIATPQEDKHFTITGCEINRDELSSNRDIIMKLKYKYWDDALYQYGKDTAKRVCFHSREIRRKENAFNPSVISYEPFINDLSNIMGNLHYRLFAADIDKEAHVKRYIYPNSAYSLCMDFVLERLIRNTGVNENCIIILEARGKKEDAILLNHIKQVLENGTQFYDAEAFSKVKGVYFNPKWSHQYIDQKSYWGLELADLCAYPIHKYVTYGHKDEAYKTIEPKIYNYPNINGIGLKRFP